MIENKILKKFFFLPKLLRGKHFFRAPLVKAKNQHQNFEKHLKQKRGAVRRVNIPNFCYCF